MGFSFPLLAHHQQVVFYSPIQHQEALAWIAERERVARAFAQEMQSWDTPLQEWKKLWDLPKLIPAKMPVTPASRISAVLTSLATGTVPRTGRVFVHSGLNQADLLPEGPGIVTVDLFSYFTLTPEEDRAGIWVGGYVRRGGILYQVKEMHRTIDGVRVQATRKTQTMISTKIGD